MEEAAHIRHLYHDCLTPGGRRYSQPMLARMYRVSVSTIANAIDRKKAYGLELSSRAENDHRDQAEE